MKWMQCCIYIRESSMEEHSWEQILESILEYLTTAPEWWELTEPV